MDYPPTPWYYYGMDNTPMPGREAITAMLGRRASLAPRLPTPEEAEQARETFLRSWTARVIERRLGATESPMQGFELLGGAL